MKKILFIFATAALLAACNDGFLDKKPLDKLSEEAVFNSDALAEAYINAIYTVLPDPFTEGNIGCISDEGFFRYGGTSTRYIADGSMTPSSIIPMDEGGPAHNTRTTFLNIWNRAYEYIYRLNYFLRYVEEKGSAMTEEGKNRLTGEAYFLRAWAYTNLIERYGGVVLVDKPFDDIGADFVDVRSNFDDCVTFINKDLDKAIDLLPDKSNTALGRVHKDCVLALRSRLTLIVASPLFNDPNFPTGGVFRGAYSESKWQDAYDAAKAICDRADVDGAYALDDTYDGFWRDENSPEIIWGKYFVQSSNQPHKAQLLYSLMDFGGGGWESFNPTQAMWLDYEMKATGKKIFEEGSGYDPKHPFKGRDPRFDHCIIYPTKIYTWTDKNGGLNETPLELYLLYENAESPYVNVVSVNEENKDTDEAKALAAAVLSQKVVDYFENYEGQAISVVEEPTDGFDESVDYAALAGKTIKVICTLDPHSYVLEIAKEILAEKGIKLDITIVDDYVTPNTIVNDGDAFANFFAHSPYQEDFNAQNGTKLVTIAGVHVEPMGLYAGKQSDLAALGLDK